MNRIFQWKSYNLSWLDNILSAGSNNPSAEPCTYIEACYVKKKKIEFLSVLHINICNGVKDLKKERER